MLRIANWWAKKFTTIKNLKLVVYIGRNLMDLAAGSDPCQFARELAKTLFGEKENCSAPGLHYR